MKGTSYKYALAALRERRGEIAREIKRLELSLAFANFENRLYTLTRPFGYSTGMETPQQSRQNGLPFVVGQGGGWE